MSLMKLFQQEGGHITVALFVFIVGVLLLFSPHADMGKEVIIGSLSSLWTILKINKTDTTGENK